MEKTLAKKENMTQIFTDSGEALAVTLVKLEKAEEAASLSEGQNVTVSGISKGKGFQGVVKRHGFHGGPRSHGQKHSEREPGSISGSGGRAGGRVAKNMRMAGRMGGDRITVKNLKVIKIIAETGEVFISGAIPGRRGTKLTIKGN
jgi:large subunit ribosomal protein L3